MSPHYQGDPEEFRSPMMCAFCQNFLTKKQMTEDWCHAGGQTHRLCSNRRCRAEIDFGDYFKYCNNFCRRLPDGTPTGEAFMLCENCAFKRHDRSTATLSRMHHADYARAPLAIEYNNGTGSNTVIPMTDPSERDPSESFGPAPRLRASALDYPLESAKRPVRVTYSGSSVPDCPPPDAFQ